MKFVLSEGGGRGGAKDQMPAPPNCAVVRGVAADRRATMARWLTPLLFLLAACGGLMKVSFGPKYVGARPIYFKDNPALSEGDRVAGRRAFIDSRCTDCHRVAEDQGLPLGPRAVAEPPLEKLDRYPPKTLYDLIINRNTGKGVELYNREMGVYVERLSARQLVDIVAYLRDPRQVD
jgi:mono/diheme cytochrome c family protein